VGRAYLEEKSKGDSGGQGIEVRLKINFASLSYEGIGRKSIIGERGGGCVDQTEELKHQRISKQGVRPIPEHCQNVGSVSANKDTYNRIPEIPKMPSPIHYITQKSTEDSPQLSGKRTKRNT